MKFGVREICDVVFKAKSSVKIGKTTFIAGQPVLYIDTATASSLEQASTTVYAQGGKGNSRLIAWDGEKTLTFTLTDALMSPVGLSILAGAGLFKGKTSSEKTVNTHFSSRAYVNNDGVIDLASALTEGETISSTAPLFISAVVDGEIGEMIKSTSITGNKITVGATQANKEVFVDGYVAKAATNVSEIQIDASSFSTNFYVEASTLFRRQSDGMDVPAEITLPSVKIQSNITFSMAATGDPSTFDFTMDAFPDYTMFDRTKKVLCVIQILEDSRSQNQEHDSVMYTENDELMESVWNPASPTDSDSYTGTTTGGGQDT